MNREQIEKLVERYQAKADRAYRNYQETGITRYDTAYRNNDDLATALRMAARSADDANELAALRVTLSDLAYSAKKIYATPEAEIAEAAKRLADSAITEAKIRGLIRED